MEQLSSHQNLPSTHMARDIYLEEGGDLTAFSFCGNDPLRNRQELLNGEMVYFYDRNPSYQEIYSNVSSSDGQQLKCGILSFIVWIASEPDHACIIANKRNYNVIITQSS